MIEELKELREKIRAGNITHNAIAAEIARIIDKSQNENSSESRQGKK